MLLSDFSAQAPTRRLFDVRLQQPDVWIVCALVLLCLCLFIASESAWYGDAMVYASDIRAGALIEPGHLLWRPLMKLIEISIDPRASFSSVLWQLQYACLAASVLAVVAMYFLAQSMYGRLAAAVVAVLMAVSNGFWTYSFSGCSYTLGLLFAILALGFTFSDRAAGLPARAFLAGVCGGLSAAAWALQALAAPAIWLALLLTPSRATIARAGHLKNTALFATGYALSFVIPVLCGYWVQAHSHAAGLQPAPGHGGVAGLGAWASTSAHGIPAHFGVAQALRVALGWPQSFISLAGLGSKLRLWQLHEATFPASPWLLVLVFFYCALACVTGAVAAAYTRLQDRDRALVVAGTVGIVTNLAFAASWQGGAVERYFPSLPFQLLLVALAIAISAKRASRIQQLVGAIVLLTGVAICNWYGTFAPLLASDSFRQTWLRELRHATAAGDLVVLFGQRMSVINAPHEANMAKIDDVSNEIVMRGDGWRDAELRNIVETRRRGGRVFLADSLFAPDDSPRNGWSFKEYPRPTPTDLRNAFLPYKSERVAFVAAGERVWLGNE